MDDPEKRDDRRDEKPWWDSSFDAGYAARYAHRDESEASLALDTLFAAGVAKRGDHVLDLCCGGGRHLAGLANRAGSVVGLDYSRDLLDLARSRATSARLVRGDMRSLPFRSRSFDAVLQMFTAFGYFEEDRENEQVLLEVARVLLANGWYVLDLFNTTPTLRSLVPEQERTDADGRTMRESRRFDPSRRRIEKATTIVGSDGVGRSLWESVRCFAPAELDAWLERAGFVVERRFGDYAGSAFDAERSPRMITLARRRHDEG